MAEVENKTNVNATIGKDDERYAFARTLYLKGGYNEADADEFQEIHCMKRKHPWISNGFCQTFTEVSGKKCRAMMYFPSQELQPHKHDTDEEFVVTVGGADVWIWTEQTRDPIHTRYNVGDNWAVKANTVLCVRADRIDGLTFHEVSGEGCFAKRATELQEDLENYVMPTPFAGKTVLVTGANRGLGLGFASHFTVAGARVVACCRDPSKATELCALEPTPIVVPLDVSSEDSVAALPALLEEKGVTSLDFLINNAGISVPNHPNDPILRTTPSLVRQVMEVNVVGTVHLTQVLLPLLDRGSIRTMVNLSSQLGSIGNCWALLGWKGGVSCYRMSRAANNMAVRCFAGELEERGYICIALSPGHVATDMGSAGGISAPLTVDQSLAGMLNVIGKLKLEDNGRFLHYDGTELPW